MALTESPHTIYDFISVVNSDSGPLWYHSECMLTHQKVKIRQFSLHHSDLMSSL